jgi:hypothetical protein
VTIKPGVDWGHEVSGLVDPLEVRTDADLVASLREPLTGEPPLVRGGDLHRTLGSPAPGPGTLRLPIDLIAVVADERRFVAVAHVVARRGGMLGWWRGAIVAIMNAEYLGGWDVAPRAHPNDGWLDVVEVGASMAARARYQAWRRLSTGAHLPHPDITTRRVRQVTFAFETAMTLWVDGIERGTARSLRVSVEPDAAEVYV